MTHTCSGCLQWFVDEQLKCEAAADITTPIVAVEKEGGSETGTIPSTEETARVIGECVYMQQGSIQISALSQPYFGSTALSF